ncbi:lipid-binding SYLF domain-containing protein [Marinivivus vitaminiproducens]|uniref:lipid-binding SYLF domain-containing protein n=1 Tax=Marinivivus vitaminiproducens TaxID=3035935 RepID=UPI0027A02B2B|nr:lipid-binding SYLF domain-containing protein [Geminicoccaceae bacterium SCSIO 64248]
MSLARRALLPVMLLAGILSGCLSQDLPPRPGVPTDQERLVERSTLALQAFRVDANFRQLPLYVQNAWAVVVIPDTLKAGFIAGAEYGSGLMMIRNVQTGGWHEPVFINLYGGSFGLQFGGKTSDLVFTVMNENSVRKILANQMKLGADASVTVGQRGGGIGAGTTLNLGEDLYVFARSQGLFGGFALDGTALTTRHDWNAAYYGRVVTTDEITQGGVVSNPASRRLQDELGAFDTMR